MKLEDLARELGSHRADTRGHRQQCTPRSMRGYASDLLSDVLAHAPEGGVLVTLQVHLNVIAVASHAELAAVIFAGGRRPEDDVLAKAVAEGISLFVSPADTFDVVGRLYALGVTREPCVNVCAADLHIHTALSPCADERDDAAGDRREGDR